MDRDGHVRVRGRGHPSTDPFSMLMLGISMLFLFLVAELVSRLLDRRRARA